MIMNNILQKKKKSVDTNPARQLRTNESHSKDFQTLFRSPPFKDPDDETVL